MTTQINKLTGATKNFAIAYYDSNSVSELKEIIDNNKIDQTDLAEWSISADDYLLAIKAAHQDKIDNNQARQYFDLYEGDNTVLDVKNLERAAKQRDQNWDDGKTAYIFADGSAIIDCGDNDFEVVADYGLSVDHEQL